MWLVSTFFRRYPIQEPNPSSQGITNISSPSSLLYIPSTPTSPKIRNLPLQLILLAHQLRARAFELGDHFFGGGLQRSFTLLRMLR